MNLFLESSSKNHSFSFKKNYDKTTFLKPVSKPLRVQFKMWFVIVISLQMSGRLSYFDLRCLTPPSLSSAKLSDRDTEQGTCWNDKREATWRFPSCRCWRWNNWRQICDSGHSKPGSDFHHQKGFLPGLLVCTRSTVISPSPTLWNVTEHRVVSQLSKPGMHMQ